MLVGTIAVAAAGCGSGSQHAAGPGGPAESKTSNSGETKAAAAKQGELTFGMVFPFSGPAAEYGTIFAEGVELGQELLQQHDPSVAMHLVRVDGQGLPDPSTTGMQQLVSVDHAQFVATAITSVSSAIAPVGARSHVLMFNGGGLDPSLAELSPYFLNLVPLNPQQFDQLLPYVVEKRHLKKMAVVYSNDAIGTSTLSQTKSYVESHGGTIVKALSIAPEATDFAAQAAQLSIAQPEVIEIALSLGGTQYSQLMKQVREAGVKAVFIGAQGINTPSVLSLPEAKGTLYAGESLDMTLKTWPTSAFMEAWEKKHGSKEQPSFYVANYANAVLMSGELAKQVREEGKPVNGETLLAALHSTKTFELVGGEVTLNSDGTTFQLPTALFEFKGVNDVAPVQ
jgi:ABC-type branched-subunit amino acid transport system substrate-binding protein